MFLILLLLLNSTQQQCTCSQLRYELECTQNTTCEWKNLECITRATSEVTQTNTIPTYCSLISLDQCRFAKSCALIGNQCIAFTGCTAYKSQSDEEYVQNQMDSSYKNQKQCSKNKELKLCYWDESSSKCSLADTCAKLPKSLVLDSECRYYLKECTTKLDGGCVESGLNCEDQTLEIQCHSNRNQSQSCFWNGQRCVDRVCANSIKFNSQDLCSNYLNTCILKKGGGCMDRGYCQDAQVEEACIVDINGDACFWNGNSCVNKICSNALQSYTTNKECQNYLSYCIAKKHGGCIENGECESAQFEQACQQNKDGVLCYWNEEQCVQKTCENAPQTYSTQQQCEKFLDNGECTVKWNKFGCEKKNCQNAPDIYRTMDQCQTWLPGCIPLIGGSCIELMNCEMIQTQDGCLKDSQGQECVWQDGKCYLRVCENAKVATYNEAYCSQFHQSCIPDIFHTQCQLRSCTSIREQRFCNIDYKGQPCIWKGDCYMKTCRNASTSYKTHSECNNYLEKCTVNQLLSGCMDLPISCLSLERKEQCVKNILGERCGWLEDHCTNANCYTADTNSFDTTSKCQSYLIECVVKNDRKGCMAIPELCSDRKLKENCEVSDQKCFWDIINQNCIPKGCGTQNVLDCGDKCIINNLSNGCIDKPISCDSLLIHQCKDQAIINGNCYWNGSKCVAKICSNVLQSTDAACRAILSQCTVNNTATSCMDSKSKCSDYLNSDQCRYDANNGKCTWEFNKCRNVSCADAPNTITYTTHQSCNSFLNICTMADLSNVKCIPKSSTCWGITKEQCYSIADNTKCLWAQDVCQPIAQLGQSYKCQDIVLSNYTNCLNDTNNICTTDNSKCIEKTCSNIVNTIKYSHEICNNWLNKCTTNRNQDKCILIQDKCDLYSQLDCYRSTNSLCHWNGLQCLNIGTKCEELGLTSYTHQNCNHFNSNCTEQFGICVAKECNNYIGDYSYTNCQAYLPSCSVNRNQSKCIPQLTYCSYYTLESDCYKSAQGTCNWNGVKCISETDCNMIIPYIWSQQSCSDMNSLCTKNSVQCITKVCSNYQNLSNTFVNIDQCNTFKTNCVSTSNNLSCEDRSCTNYYGPIFTHSTCNSWSSSCTSNSSHSACQIQQNNCSSYQQPQCYHATEGYCYMNGSTCSVMSTACNSINLFSYSHSACNEINNLCTVKRNQTGCVTTSATCSSIALEIDCYKANQSCNWNSGCVDLNMSADCSTISIPNGLNVSHEFCSSLNSKCTNNSTNTSCINREGDNYKGLRPSPINCGLWSSNSVFYENRCKTKSCSDKQDSYSYGICNSYLNICSVNRRNSKCITIKSSCDLYEENDCYKSQNSYCNLVNGLCVNVSTCSTLKPYQYDQCHELNNNCIRNKLNNYCIDYQKTCDLYQTEDQCYQAIEGYCNWMVIGYKYQCILINNNIKCEQLNLNNYTHQNCSILTKCTMQNNKCVNRTCDNYSLNVYNHNECNLWNNQCTVNRSHNKCINIPSTCNGQVQDNCFIAASNIKCNWDGIQCTQITTQTCSQLNVSQYTYNICQQLNSTCTNSLQPCIPKTCSAYNGTLFTHKLCNDYYFRCTTNRSQTACITIQNECASYNMNDCLYLIDGQTCFWNGSTCVSTNNYSCTQLSPPSLCSTLNSSCITNSTNTGCILKECSSYTGIYSFDNCQNWMKSCSVNSIFTACVQIQQDCSSYSLSDHCYKSQNSYCSWINSKCVARDCQYFNNVTATHSTCESFLSTCTVQRIGQCLQLKENCQDYSIQQQCYETLSKQSCYWNLSSKCVIRNCDNLGLSSHTSCQNALSSCTVQANGIGCQSKVKCSLYTSQIQCQVNQSGGQCVWVNQNAPQYCTDKSCTTAPLSYQSHEECQQYLNKQCTIRETQQGCMDLQANCTQYTIQTQCIIDSNNRECGWDGNKCQFKSCRTAILNIYSHQNCQQYLKTCTIGNDQQSCISIPDQCNQMKIEEQCLYSAYNIQCYWNGTQCVDRTCENAPNKDSCNTHMKGCVNQIQKCFNIECEDYYYSTDQQCKQINMNCTSDGLKCLQKPIRCQEALTQIICNNIGCGWNDNKCDIKSCQTAPITYISISQCESYLQNCVPKLRGGCMDKGECQLMSKQSCDNSIYCYWIDNGICRNKYCSDILSSSHKVCQFYNNKCTYGGNGKCTDMNICSQYNIAQGCILGTDGPCLFINNKCYQYNDCTSITFNTDEQCKLISPQCTTDGIKCIAISKCEQNNINGCVTGIDGNCMYTDQCKLFTQCTDAGYINHQRCQQVNKQCTSDMKTTCIDLKQCQQYDYQSNCIINNKGQIIQNGSITSTGKCIWDTTHYPYKCRDQKCQDLIGNTHIECNQQLNTCTTNGLSCIDIAYCQNYTSYTTCMMAKSIDGQCVWRTTHCAKKECSDIINEISITSTQLYTQDCQNRLPNCVSDGMKCINKLQCNNYSLEDSCRGGGTDGTCIWDNKQNKCNLMIDCSTPLNDRITCLAHDCHWDGTEYMGTCAQHNCSTYYQSHNECISLLNRTCQFKDNQCIQSEPEYYQQVTAINKAISPITGIIISAQIVKLQETRPQVWQHPYYM